jgi:hypothetical protein
MKEGSLVRHLCVIVRKDDGRRTVVKENDGDGWSSDGVVLWLGRRQNGDTIEWKEWARLWESGCPRRVVGGSGVDSML